MVPVVELVHVVDLVEVADVVAHFSEEAHLSLPEPLPPALLQLQLDVDGPLEVDEHLHQLVDLSVCLSLVDVVHGLGVLDLDEGAGLHRKRGELPSVPSDWGITDIVLALFLAVKQQQTADERMSEELRLRLLLLFAAFLLEELGYVPLPVERVHAHIMGVELKLSLHYVIQHDCLLGVHAQWIFGLDGGDPIAKLTLLRSSNAPQLLLLLVGDHGFPHDGYLLEKLGEYPLEFSLIELAEEGLGLGMEFVEPERDVEVVVLEEAHDLLEVLEILAVDVDVLADDLAPLAQLLRGLLAVREGALAVSLGLRLEVAEAVYPQEAVLFGFLVAVGGGVADDLLDH